MTSIDQEPKAPTEVNTRSPGRQDFSLKSRIEPSIQIWGRLPKVGLGLVQDFLC